MKKYFLSACLCSFLVLSLTGCPNPQANNKKTVENKGYERPVFTPEGGFYKEAQDITIECDDSEKIYYTLDLSEPTEESTLYSEPIKLDEQSVIRAMAVKSDGTKRYAMTAYDFDLDRTTDSSTHMESPEWQDQVIYFVMTDRFFNGDTTNDNQEEIQSDGTDYDETVPITGQNVSGYNGGDFKGLTKKLDYIKSLGCTAIWITPPVKNQVTEGAYHGFHGYWASDFLNVDPHLGTLKDYQDFVKAAHDKGLYVIQDIVVNHTGDYIRGNSVIEEGMVKTGNITSDDFYLNEKSITMNSDYNEWKHPEQLPWAFNDVTKYTTDEFANDAFYHFNPCISNFVDSSQTLTYQESGLDDIATDNETVRRLLSGYFRYWIDKVDIDGYRIDTALYVEPEFFEGFINGTESGNKGVRAYAAELGKDDFIDFGEAWTTVESTSASYTKDNSTGTPRMDSIIYFPLTMAVRDAVSGGSKGTSQITTVLNNRYDADTGYYMPSRMVTFIDNHDLERLITIASDEMTKAAYGLIMTLPGIPQFYYGTEQGFTTTRKAMFQGGYGGDIGNTRTTNDTDYFDESGDWYDFEKALITLRKENRVFRYNRVHVIKDTTDSAGLFAYDIQGRDEHSKKMTGAGARALFVMNTSTTDQLLNVTDSKSNLVAGDYFVKCEPSSSGCVDNFTVGEGKSVQMVVPAQSYAIYILDQSGIDVSSSEHSVEILGEVNSDNELVDITSDTVIDGNEITIRVKSSEAGSLKVILNSDYTNSQSFTVSEAGEADYTVDLSKISNGLITIELEETIGELTIYSGVSEFTIQRPWIAVGSYSDSEGDDNGPDGYTYTLPNGFEGTLDITNIDVATSGKDIKLTVTMKTLSRSWNPTTNLFDHCMFTVMLAKPDSTTGCSVQPNHNYTLPDNFKWDYMYKAAGWSNAYYSSIDADATNSGTSVTPAPSTNVSWPDAETVESLPDEEYPEYEAKVEFIIRSASIGYPESLEGWKIYLNDYDMDFDQLRGLVSGDEFVLDKYAFGCGDADPATAPKVIDESQVMTISYK